MKVNKLNKDQTGSKQGLNRDFTGINPYIIPGKSLTTTCGIQIRYTKSKEMTQACSFDRSKLEDHKKLAGKNTKKQEEVLTLNPDLVAHKPPLPIPQSG